MATVADVMQMLREREGELVVLSPAQTIESAMEILHENHILSAPLVSSSGRFLGIVDVHDMVYLVVESYKQGKGPESWVELLKDTLDKCANRTRNKDISFLAKGPGTSKAISDVVTSKFLGGNVHRLAVSDCDGHPLAIFSQSDVLRYLTMQPTLIGPKASKTLQELGLAQRPVTALPDTALTIDGLVLMHSQHLRVLPVTNHSGQLVAQLSTASLRGLCTRDLPLLMKPVLQFLSSPPAKNRQVPAPLRLKATDTLQKCIIELCSFSAHESFVVNEVDNVMAVITLTDVLRQIWG